MHSDTLCNPMHPLTKQMKEISSIRNKKDEHHIKMAELEFQACIYYDSNLGVYMPSDCIYASFQAAARKYKLGTYMKAVLLESAIGYPIKELKGKTPVSLWNEKNADGMQKYTYTKSVVVSRSRIMRTRFITQNWSLKISGDLLVELMSIDQLFMIAQTAGLECGLCELRPQKGRGSFGKFTIESFKSEGKEYVKN